MNLFRNMFLSAMLLGLFAIIGTGIVALTFDNTAERIAKNEREFLLKNLHILVTPDVHDNDLFTDLIKVTDKEYLGSYKPINIYRARKAGKNVAAIINAVAPDGYNGDIELLIAIDDSGKIMGVRATKHKETPGLGDAIETNRSDWIFGFTGKTLNDPKSAKWRVKRDGGAFDQFTGATITPRAIVKAVHKALQYYKQHKEMIFSQKTVSLIPSVVENKGQVTHE